MEDKILCSACLCMGRNLKSFRNTEFNDIYRMLLHEIPAVADEELYLCFECRARFRAFQKFQQRMTKNYNDLMKCLRRGTSISQISKSPQLKTHTLASTSYPEECENGTDIKPEELEIKTEPINYEECHYEPETFANELEEINKDTSTRNSLKDADKADGDVKKSTAKRSKRNNLNIVIEDKGVISDKSKGVKRGRRSSLASTSYPEECENGTDIKPEELEIKTEPINYEECHYEPETFANELEEINKDTSTRNSLKDADKADGDVKKSTAKRSKRNNLNIVIEDKGVISDKSKGVKRGRRSNKAAIKLADSVKDVTKSNKAAIKLADSVNVVTKSLTKRCKKSTVVNDIDNTDALDDVIENNVNEESVEISISGDAKISELNTDVRKEDDDHDDMFDVDDVKDDTSDDGVIDVDDMKIDNDEVVEKGKKSVKKSSAKVKCKESVKSVKREVKHGDGTYCHLCKCNFKNEEQLDEHKEEVHNMDPSDTESPIICNKCGEASSNEMKHQLHLTRTHYARPQCAQCGKMFSSMKTYRYHLNVIHKGQNRFPCPQCGKIYQWKSNLWRHLKNHKARESGELYCMECDKRFSSVATYQQHLRISRRHCHENDYNFVCSECGKKFVTKTRLRDHVDWEHLKKINYRCTICNKAFKSKTSLYVHLQNVHKSKDDKDNLCHVCGKSYQNIAKLKYHIIAMHTSATPYACDKCPAAFSWYSSLYRHNKEVHDKVKLSKSKKSRREDTTRVGTVASQI